MSQASIALTRNTNNGSFLTMFLISLIAHFLSILLFVFLPQILPHHPREAFGGPSGGAYNVNWVRLGPGTQQKTSLKPTAEKEAAPSRTIEKLTKDETVELKSQLTLPDQSTKKKEAPQPKATLNQPEKKTTGPFGAGKNTKIDGGTTGGGQGKFGLGTAGSGGAGPGGFGTGTGVEFPFPWYIDRVIDKVEGTWVKPFISQPPAQALQTVVYFVITRTGQAKDVKVEQSSGVPALDRSAESAILNSQPFPPLPPQWTDPDLAFRLTFQYTQ